MSDNELNTDSEDLLEAITNEYRTVGQLRGPLTEPGWKTPDGKLFQIYYRLNTGKEDALMAKYLANPTDEGLASFLCMKMLKSDGTPYLSPAASVVMLNRGLAASMGRVANKIISAHDEISKITDDALGNSYSEIQESE